MCAGSIISPKLLISAYHCTYNKKDGTEKPCDHSDGKRLAVLGRHKIEGRKTKSYFGIPIIDVKYPPNQRISSRNFKSHDLAILVLKDPIVYSSKIRPICLPTKDEEFYGRSVTTVGWGRTGAPKVNKKQSPVLKWLQLKVSEKRYKHKKMFGTELNKVQQKYQDPCSGDSGDIGGKVHS